MFEKLFGNNIEKKDELLQTPEQAIDSAINKINAQGKEVSVLDIQDFLYNLHGYNHVNVVADVSESVGSTDPLIKKSIEIFDEMEKRYPEELIQQKVAELQ